MMIREDCPEEEDDADNGRREVWRWLRGRIDLNSV